MPHMTRWQGYMNTPRASVKSMRSKSWASHWQEQSWVAAGVQASTLLLPGKADFPQTYPWPNGSSRPRAPQHQRTNFLLPYKDGTWNGEVPKRVCVFLRKLQPCKLWNHNPHHWFWEGSTQLDPQEKKGESKKQIYSARAGTWLMPTTVLVRGREVHHVLIGRRNLGDVGEPISTWNWRQCMVHMAAIWRLGNHNLDHLLCLAMSFSLCCYFQIICQSLKPLFYFSRRSCVSVTKSQARRKARMKS